MNEIIGYVIRYIFLPLHTMPLRSIQDMYMNYSFFSFWVAFCDIGIPQSNYSSLRDILSVSNFFATTKKKKDIMNILYRFLCGIFYFFGICAQSAIVRLYGKCMFSSFSKKLTHCFTEWLYYFSFPSIKYEHSNFSTLLPTCGIFTFYFSCSDRCIVISLCDFNLHSLIPNDIEYLFMFLFVNTLNVFCPFLNELLVGFTVRFWEFFMYYRFESFTK